ncbi:flavin-binding monooxygenase [Marmoricola endophyticus]|uniref:Flavin-binding monooxygenase n=1 Tax=Marmoricola endophyticus TaxID=2040280 RepID=A0A917BFH6_9ACTN|nr:NAD(P)/FAD-dependent oxidoreductase [Marmoricola endophyticus]GGF40796.1 flavin-binding monooxygenase [Marmoricola endophyticus]
MSETSAQVRVIVVGAGFGGIAAAIELTEHGYDDVTVLESAAELGGTWYHNVYPGAACDVPSHFYSFSFDQRASWSRFCSPQEEILDYLREVARAHGVDRRVVTGQRVTSCAWDEGTGTWTVVAEAPDGTTTTRTADALLIATGQLDKPSYPRIEGLEDFTGPVLHSARWDTDLDLTGRRVAVIGTGATAAQLVPELAEAAAHTTVFQRSGNWFLPRRSKEYSAPVKALLAHVPGLNRVFRALLAAYLEFLTAAIRHPRTLGRVLAAWSTLFMRGQLRDPEVRRTAWPDYTFGCRRVLFSSSYLPALQRPDVTLVGDAVTAMTERGPRTADGRVHEVDVVALATGFRTTDFMFPMEVTGSGGRRLREDWADGPRAHLGMTVPGYPNLFLLYGPNTNTSGGSIVFFLEHQARYVRQALDLGRERKAALDVRPEVASSSDVTLQGRFVGTAWVACDSWYRDESGRIVANWPGYMREYADATREVEPADFRYLPVPG